MNDRMRNFFMSMADQCAAMSRAKRLQVGAIITKENNIISFSWNGTPAGWDNNCEDRIYNTRFEERSNGQWMDILTYRVVDIDEIYPMTDEDGKRFCLRTKPEVIHAERNALDKLAKNGGVGGKDASMFITHAPCIECAKSIYGAGISHVYYRNSYRATDGIDFLEKCGVEITQLIR